MQRQAQQSRQGPTIQESQLKEAPNRGQGIQNKPNHGHTRDTPKNPLQTQDTLQAQADPKEGILSWAKPMPSQKRASYAQVLLRLALSGPLVSPHDITHDQTSNSNPGKGKRPIHLDFIKSQSSAHDPRNPHMTRAARPAHDPGKPTMTKPHVTFRACDPSHDPTRDQTRSRDKP